MNILKTKTIASLKQLATLVFLGGFILSPLDAQLVRQPNTTLNLPASLTISSFTQENAFPNLTFNLPCCIASAPGDNNTIYVVERNGLIQRVSNISNPALATKSVFLDVHTKTLTDSEQGLIGLAFHPNYASNGRFFIFYTSSGTRYDVLAEYKRSTINPNVADPSSEEVMISQLDDAPQHNSGDLHFGPDGYLYVSLGDEGGGNGQYGNTQFIDKDFFSAIMRIDVDRKAANLEPSTHPAVQKPGGVALYKVPADNPYIGATSFNSRAVDPSKVRTEFWAVGFRNPWRFCFDSANGRLFVGDVGQGAREEVDLVTKGGNYGWNYYEGTALRPKVVNGQLVPDVTLADLPPGFTSIPPIYEYYRFGTPSAVIGGVVYRGTRFPALKGQYVFGDSSQQQISSLKETSPGVWQQNVLFRANCNAFGTDPSNGDVLISSGSKILRVIAASSGGTLPATLTGTGAFANLANLTPNAGIVGFEPKVTFWSDNAKKQRWFSIPDVSKKITFANDSNWTFPNGTVWIKHFNLLMDRRNPNSARRLETRFLVSSADGTYGITYRWNDAQTEAYLVDDAGADQDFNIIDENGQNAVQHWHFPTRAECLACHSEVAGPPLGFNTRQLNANYNYGGTTANQLTALNNAGYFTATIPNPANLPTYANIGDEDQSLTFRSQSYFGVNCSQCHQPGGTAPTAWDARASRNILNAGILYGSVAENLGNPANKVIVPGDTLHSVLLNKISASNGFSRMPPLATFELDHKGIDLITRWVNTELKTGYSQSINSGGTAQAGFVADIGFTGGSVSTTAAAINTSGVADAAPAVIYQSERRGGVTYTLGGLVSNRPYLVKLHFAETQFAVAGSRVFNILINGQTVQSNLDIFQSAGAKNKALVLSFNPTANGLGKINIQLVGVTGVPSICAVQSSEVKRDSIIAVHGGYAVGGFTSDTGFVGSNQGVAGPWASINTTGVVDAGIPDLYKTQRIGPMTYTLGGAGVLQSGRNYQLLLHFVEYNFQEAGRRLINVIVNGQTRISNLDIFAEAGAFKALVKKLDVQANASGQIVVQLTASMDFPRICALEVRDVPQENTEIELQAESGALTAPMAAVSDSTAMGGQSIEVTTGPSLYTSPVGGGSAIFNFNVPVTGRFSFSGRSIASTPNTDSFWVRVDNNPWVYWSVSHSSTWTWNDIRSVSNGNAQVIYDLSPGSHTLSITHREPKTRLDAVRITPVNP